jgi:AcrR family transcriptional regulator
MTSTETGGRLPLTRERILDAAVSLVDAEGVDALTMRKLGSELGVEAMSIYNHIPNKAALLDGIVATVVAEIEIPPHEMDWTERLRLLGRSFRAMALRHPQVIPLLALRPLRATPALEQIEVVFEALADAGAEPRQAADAYRVMADFALGFSMTEVADQLGSADPTEAFANIDLDDLSGYPHLLSVVPFLVDADAGAQFEFGLDVLIEGVRRQFDK